MNYFLSINRMAYLMAKTLTNSNLHQLVNLLILLLGLLGIATWVQAGAVTSGQQTSVPNASTDPNQPSIYDTNGIPNSGMPTQGNKLACNNPEGNPNGCGESNIASQGNQSQTNAGAGNPINVITGNKYQREDDMPALPGMMGIEIVRHYNSLHMGLGQIGYGWRLSYETDLQIVRNQIYIHQADGSRVIFNRSSINPSDCACQNPAQGHVMIYHTPKGDEYTWYWLDGKQLHFNHQGKLTRITAATGESVKLTRGLRGELLKVTDPQGRSLVMHYANQHQAGFKGIVAIDTPVGRYTYHHDNDLQSPGISNLIGVEYPHNSSDKTSLQRHYLYGEPAYVSAQMVGSHRQPVIPQSSHLLTGIQLTWQAGKKQQQQRLRTWAYDTYGRGVLSVHGLPKQLDYNGKPKTGTGIEQVTLSYALAPIQTKRNKHSTKQSKHSKNPRISHNGQLGQTILTNSLGQTTKYTYTLIAGEPRLLQVVGAGCAECGETNRVYGYDKLGRLSHNTQVKVVNSPATAAKAPKLQGLQTTYTEYDPIGRPIRISNIGYINGKAQAPTLKVRYAYANTPSFPQLNSAPRAVEEPVYVANKPSLIAIPSVVAGKERQWHITYNQHGQPTKVTELGYRPALIAQHEEAHTQISRTITYRYQTINGRSLLAQMDGPLPNGTTNTPRDSDITQYQFDKLGQYLTQVISPKNVITQLSYDVEGLQVAKADVGGTGRLLKKIESNLIATEFTYNQFGKITYKQRYPASLDLASAKEEGLLQSTTMAYDILGNTTMIKRPDGQAVFMQYSSDGKLTAMRDALGNRVEWKDWEKAKHQQDETVTTQQLYSADEPNTVARAWYFWRDDQNRLTQRLSPDGGLDTWQYNQGDASNFQTQWVQHLDPLNRITLNVVSIQGRAQVRMTPAGYMDASFSTTAYLEEQAANQPSNAQPAQGPVQMQDDFGRIIQFSSPQHGTHTAEYSGDNRITHILQPDGTTVDYIYDVAGRLLQKSAKSPQVTKSDSKNVANNITYQYDAFGLKVVTDGMQTTQYIKDALGREVDKSITLNLKNKAPHTYHIRTRYNAQGHIKAKQLADGNWLVFSLYDKTGLTNAMTLHNPIWPSVTNKLADWFNAPDLPLQIATRETVVNDIKVHPFNGITQLTHGNGIHSNYEFDLAGRLIAVQHGKGAVSPTNKASVMQASYQYDAGRRLVAENISVANMPAQAREYAYQAWNQLATAPKAGHQKATFTQPTARDTNAINPNQTSAATLTAQIKSAQALGQLKADVQIDNAGRVVDDGQYRYQYQAWGRLSTVSNQQGKPLVHYAYNAWGERIMTQVEHDQDNSHYYLYDHQQRVAELDAAGNITQQYFYVNGMPVAVKNTPSSAQKSETNPAQLLAVHTDRRHAPVAVTDESGKVIWQAGYDAWGGASVASPFKGEGKVSPINHQANQSNKLNNFSLALRLPGQWEDDITHIYYNYQRDYNPDTGRYLTPDPLGFPDGLDPYAYVNNDPLNKLDPLGLYQIDMHYYMTLFLGITAGLDPEVAKIIALAAQYIDDNPMTSPIDMDVNGEVDVYKSVTTNQQRLKYYHFMQDLLEGGDIHKVDNEKNQLNKLYNAYLTANKNACGKADMIFFGEMIHALADTYSHAKPDDTPYTGVDIFGNGTGHGLNDSDPDYTFNHYGYSVFVNKLFPGSQPNANNGGTYWGTNADRTLASEQAIFSQFISQSTWTKTGSASFADLEDTLVLFNQTGESEQYTFTWDANGVQTRVKHDETDHANLNSINESFALKLGILNSKLKELGFNVDLFDPKWGYNMNEAAGNRQDNLGSLTCKDYPGVILPNGGPC